MDTRDRMVSTWTKEMAVRRKVNFECLLLFLPVVDRESVSTSK